MKTKIIILSISFLFIGNGCQKNVKDYHHFKIITKEDIVSINDGQFYLYFYLEGCAYCQQLKEEIFSFAQAVQNFYFINCAKLTFPIIYEENITFKILGTPTLLYIDFMEYQQYLGVLNIRFYLNEYSKNRK